MLYHELVTETPLVSVEESYYGQKSEETRSHISQSVRSTALSWPNKLRQISHLVAPWVLKSRDTKQRQETSSTPHLHTSNTADTIAATNYLPLADTRGGDIYTRK